MTPVDPSTAREFLEALVAAFSILGGVMAYTSGFAATTAQDQSADALAHRINEGIAEGFRWGAGAAVLALIIIVWT
ncbi:MAG TPA: hypothetical protein VFY04_07975 [Solirubrobacterales bacterium]|nr:hypothetical protein [Solirubrobacterales bacterium]